MEDTATMSNRYRTIRIAAGLRSSYNPDKGLTFALDGLTHDDISTLRAALAGAVANFAQLGNIPGQDELTKRSAAALEANAERLYQLTCRAK